MFVILVRTINGWGRGALIPIAGAVTRITPKFIFTKAIYNGENRYEKTQYAYRLFDDENERDREIARMMVACEFEAEDKALNAHKAAKEKREDLVMEVIKKDEWIKEARK